MIGGRPLRALVVAFAIGLVVLTPGGGSAHAAPVPSRSTAASAATPAPTPVDNFTASINRLVELVALAGSGILALVWARVAFSWFSNDITKKVQAKDRARDALIGTLLFVAAISGLIWGLAHWVITGS
jgi:hypothetical protein